MLPTQRPGFFQALVILGTGDSAKDLKAAITAKRIWLTKIVATVATSAAQSVVVQDDSGTVKFLKIGATPGIQQFTWESANGVAGTVGEKIEAVTSAAGLEVYFYIEGYSDI